MAIDYWKLVKEFNIGDWVQRFAPASGSTASPFMGYVTTVHRGLGTLDVQWPYGNEQMFPDDLIKVDPRLSEFLPKEGMDQTYMTLETEKARQRWASSAGNEWRESEVPAGFYRDLAKLWSTGFGEVSAYDQMWRRYAAYADDAVLQDVIAKYYRVATNLTKLRIDQFIKKSAAYWVAQNRQYRLSQQELKAGKPSCPKCGCSMRRTSYKMHEGASHRLYACPKDLFLIKATDLIGPEGEPIQW